MIVYFCIFFKIDLFITDSSIRYLPSLYEMTAKLHQSLYPLLVQIPATTQTSATPLLVEQSNSDQSASIALVISQTKICMNPGGRIIFIQKYLQICIVQSILGTKLDAYTYSFLGFLRPLKMYRIL